MKDLIGIFLFNQTNVWNQTNVRNKLRSLQNHGGAFLIIGYSICDKGEGLFIFDYIPFIVGNLDVVFRFRILWRLGVHHDLSVISIV